MSDSGIKIIFACAILLILFILIGCICAIWSACMSVATAVFLTIIFVIIGVLAITPLVYMGIDMFGKK